MLSNLLLIIIIITLVIKIGDGFSGRCDSGVYSYGNWKLEIRPFINSNAAGVNRRTATTIINVIFILYNTNIYIFLFSN